MHTGTWLLPLVVRALGRAHAVSDGGSSAESTMPISSSSSGSMTALPAPVVYWASSPTHVNETLLLAGAGLTDGNDYTWCSNNNSSADTTTAAAAAAAAAAVACSPADVHGTGSSLTAVIPASRRNHPVTPLSLHKGRTTLFRVNEPDVWWSMSSSPASIHLPAPVRPSKPCQLQTCLKQNLSNTPRSVTVATGDDLRVFGRSLAFDNTGRCYSAAGAPRPAAQTVLTLGRGGGTMSAHAPAPVTSHAATCYEAAFSTVGIPAGRYQDTAVSTAWGTAPNRIDLTIAARTHGGGSTPSPSLPSVVVINVEARLAFSAC